MPVGSVKTEKQDLVDGDSTTSQLRQHVQKKVPKKLAVSKEESEPKMKTKVKKEHGQQVKQPTYTCKKNDGRRWYCRRSVSHPNSLCGYHLYQKRAYLNPEFTALAAAEAMVEAEVEMKKVSQPPVASKPATTSKLATGSKPQKKKPGHDFGAIEGFYYYAGFGPFRSKRQCRSNSSMNESVPEQKQEQKDEPAPDDSPTNQQAPEDQSSCDDDIVGIAGGNEESSDDDYRLDIPGRSMNGNGEHCDGKSKNGWKKRWRKPVKARSLKSLM